MIKDLLFGGAGCATKLGDAGLLLLRVFAGASMSIAHGLGKIQDPDKVISSAEGLNFPAPMVFGWAAILSEFLGGLLLALGLMTRLAAFFIGSTMVVAAFVAHENDAYKIKELAIAYLAMMILLLCTGGGRFSVDSLIRK